MSDEVLNKKGDYPKAATCKATKEASDSEAVANAAAAANAFDENTCVVCFKNVEIFSIGECDHPVCYECSTRMRVLCQQNECPICRQVLSKVIFTLDKLPYRELETKNRSEYYSKKYQIGFYTSKIQQAFFNLLDHQCPKCNAPPYRTFNGLKNHVRKDHDLHYCDLCTEHLKIFTFERRCYTQTELGLHRVKGDVDNKSHRGHPLCEYCKCRYLDRDELFRHLRRDHYFCHFCDADGFNDFYRDYDALVEHFREDHYLCEEGKCATEQFTGAFRTEIDYKAHVANVHGKSLNKQQVKQARTLQLEITLGRRGGGRNGGQPEQGIANVRSRGNEDIHDELYEELMLSQSHQRAKTIDAQNEQDFPSLGGASGGPAMSLARAAPLSMRNRTGTAGLARTKENFPALGGGSNTSIGQQQHQSADVSGATNSNNQNSNATGMVIRVSNRPASHNAASNNAKPKSNAFDFPALPAGAKSSSFSAGHQQQYQTNVMRKPGATGAIARTSSNSTNNNNNATGMVIHVSNRPPSHNVAGTNTKSKPTALDFPSLAISGKSKKQAAAAANRQLLLEEDMLPSDNNISMNYVSSKHRTLVDDYVSVANPITFQKLQLVQREEQEAEAKKAAAEMNAPKLTVQEFPSLVGGGSSSSSNSNNKTTNTSNTWSKSNTDKKQRELENRKSKIAPAPILTKTNKTTTNSTTLSNNNEGLVSAKKDKKVKDKKPATDEVMESLTSKSTNKINREKNNNIENKSANANINNVNALLSSVNDTSNNMNVPRPPPGFVNTNTNGVNNNAIKPPPGFQSSVVVNSIAKSPNSLTFTSSLGESYSIVPTHAYIPPPESITRNQKLVEHFKESLNTPEAIDEFRHISQKFREGVYKTPAYYEHCQSALKDKFDKIFPELLALLPDINKQQALYLVHSQRLKNLTADQRKLLPHLAVCGTCKQVLLSSDLENHKKLHNLRENFPTLSSCAGKANTTTNRK